MCCVGFYVKYLNRVVVGKEFCGLITCMQNGYEIEWSLFATPIIIILSGWPDSKHHLTKCPSVSVWPVCAYVSVGRCIHDNCIEYNLVLHAALECIYGSMWRNPLTTSVFFPPCVICVQHIHWQLAQRSSTTPRNCTSNLTSYQNVFAVLSGKDSLHVTPIQVVRTNKWLSLFFVTMRHFFFFFLFFAEHQFSWNCHSMVDAI